MCKAFFLKRHSLPLDAERTYTLTKILAIVCSIFLLVDLDDRIIQSKSGQNDYSLFLIHCSFPR